MKVDFGRAVIGKAVSSFCEDLRCEPVNFPSADGQKLIVSMNLKGPTSRTRLVSPDFCSMEKWELLHEFVDVGQRTKPKQLMYLNPKP